MEPGAYLCDPKKHTKCPKTRCAEHGGPCRHTRYKIYAKEIQEEEKDRCVR